MTPETPGQPQRPTIPARILLHDISKGGMGFFCERPLSVGQPILLHLDQPKPIRIRGKISHCQEHNLSSRVLSQNAYPYRAGIEFCYELAGEESGLQKFVEEVTKNCVFRGLTPALPRAA